MNQMQLKALTAEIERQHQEEFETIHREILRFAEIGMQEFRSSRCLVEYMQGQGFAVEHPYCGFETAFCASKGTKGPKIAFLAEYDALPGYGPDKHNAHACGHNWIAAVTAGAAVTLAEVCEKAGIDAQVLLIGTPAEESYGTKVEMAASHRLDDIDLCLQAHLESRTSVCTHGLALSSLKFHYKGKAAHASIAPWDGINALDAVQLVFAGVNALRQHIRPDARIHGVVTHGGDVPNTVPDSASALFYIRAAKRSYADQLVEKMLNIAKGAELMTGAKLEVEYPELPMDDIVHLPILQELTERHLREEGFIPTLTDEEAAAAAGSSDIGNVSHVCPTMYLEVAPPNAPQPFLPHAESSLALLEDPCVFEALHAVARAMTEIALEALQNPQILDEAKKELRERI